MQTYRIIMLVALVTCLAVLELRRRWKRRKAWNAMFAALHSTGEYKRSIWPERERIR